MEWQIGRRSRPLRGPSRSLRATPWKARCFGICCGLSVGEWEATTGEPSVLATPTVEYTRGPDMGGGVGGLLYSVRSSTAKFNLSNGRGDIVAQSDSTGALSWTASYEAYGKRTKETGVNEDKQRANSKDEDPTGLLNEGFRYRDLETGVFLSRDPAGFVDGPNLYAYVMQNPWSKFDAEGLFLSALVTAGFAVYDTYQYATGKISGADYAGRMALNGAALVADAASGGMGGGLAVRMTATGSRAVTTVIKTAKAVDKANDFVENVQTAVETGQSIVEASEGEGRGLVRAAANALEDAATKKVLGAAANRMSKKDIENARRRGIDRAKRGERALVESGHPGTADEGWSLPERKQIAETGQFPKDTRWHHINDVKRNPGMADQADNVLPSRGGTAGHVEKYHETGTQNGSSGPLLDRKTTESKQREVQE